MTARDYYVVMIDHGSRGQEAVVDLSMTRDQVVGMCKSGEYDNIHFIHHIHGVVADDVTNVILAEADFYREQEAMR